MADPSNVPPVGEIRAPGMDHALYPFRKSADAPRFEWREGARIAFTVTLMVDYWELTPPDDAKPDPRMGSPLGKYSPDWLTWSQHEYGNRVGIFRVLEMLDKFGIRPTAALGAEAARRYPEIVHELRRRSAGFMAHGTHATRRITAAMDDMDEMIMLAECMDAVKNAVDEAPIGWCGQDYSQSERTPEMLAQAGFKYMTDWSNDDRPYRMNTDGLVSLPAQSEWSDIECMWHRRVAPQVWADGVVEAFNVLYDEGGACFNLTLNPWIIGQAHRIRYLGCALSRIVGRKGIWKARMDEVYWTAEGQI